LDGRLGNIPEEVAPRVLHLVGGNENDDVRALLGRHAGIEAHFRPQIDAVSASAILRECGFAWIDYFHRPDVPGPVIFKSSAFAAACAHGVVPIFPHPLSPLTLGSVALPGPFYVGDTDQNLPAAAERSRIAEQYYKWYQRFAAADQLAPAVAKMLTAEPAPSRRP
jgi:hypothetical protein